MNFKKLFDRHWQSRLCWNPSVAWGTPELWGTPHLPPELRKGNLISHQQLSKVAQCTLQNLIILREWLLNPAKLLSIDFDSTHPHTFTHPSRYSIAPSLNSSFPVWTTPHTGETQRLGWFSAIELHCLSNLQVHSKKTTCSTIINILFYVFHDDILYL